MRYNCGQALARRDNVKPDIVAGVPDSGIAHAVGYANESGVPFSRPFVKYTPTWPRSFMPTHQSKAFKAEAITIFLLACNNRSSAQLVPCSINTLRRKNKHAH